MYQLVQNITGNLKWLSKQVVNKYNNMKINITISNFKVQPLVKRCCAKDVK